MCYYDRNHTHEKFDSLTTEDRLVKSLGKNKNWLIDHNVSEFDAEDIIKHLESVGKISSVNTNITTSPPKPPLKSPQKSSSTKVIILAHQPMAAIELKEKLIDSAKNENID